MVRLSDCNFLPFVQLSPLSVRDLGLLRLVDCVRDVAQRDGWQHGGRTRGAEGRSVVVEENRPLGDIVRRDYEPCSWRVRSRLLFEDRNSGLCCLGCSTLTYVSWGALGNVREYVNTYVVHNTRMRCTLFVDGWCPTPDADGAAQVDGVV